MSDATATRQRRRYSGRAILDAFAAYPDAVSVAFYALFAIGALTAAYFAIFTQLQPYDDEGTVLLTLKAFVHGEALYRDIYSSYGPFYFELFGGFFSLTGQTITTDASRTIVMVVWTAASLFYGFAAHRLANSLVVGLIGAIAAFAALGILVNEPMHPQGLCSLLVGIFAFIATMRGARPWVGVLCGALLAALLLTKVNLGIFAIAAAVLACFLVVGSLYRLRPLRWLVIAGFLALPLAILARDLDQAWVRELLVIEVLGLGAVVVAAHRPPPQTAEEDRWALTWAKWSLVGLAVAVVAILAIILATGPSLSDIYEGMVTEAMRVRDVLVLQLSFPSAAVDWAVATFVAAALSRRLRATGGSGSSVWSGLARLGVGLLILLALAHVTPFGLNPSAGNPVIVPMLLAWVGAVPAAGRVEGSQLRFLRVLLPALAVAGTLGVYPVAGSQTGIAAAAFVPVGALCVGDGLVELKGWAAEGGQTFLDRAWAIAAAGLVAVAGVFALQSVILPTATNAVLYHQQTELPLPGATQLRLPAPAVETYVGIVNALHRHRCTALVGYPSVNSIYLWAGLEAPAPQLPNGWMDVLNRQQQQRVVDELEGSPRPCQLRNAELASFYELSGPPEQLPLVRYLAEDFKPVEEFGAFQLLLPKTGPGGT